MPAAAPEAAPSTRDLLRLALPVYMPSLFGALYDALIISTMPLYLKNQLGADAATVGTVIGMRGLGSPLAAFPAGMAVDRWSERCVMLLGITLRMISGVVTFAVAFAVAQGRGSHLGWVVSLLMVTRFGAGMGMATYQVARQSFVKAAVPAKLRGRANSLIGGTARLANVIGPAIGAGVVMAAGDAAVFMLQTVLAAVMVLLIASVTPARARVENGDGAKATSGTSAVAAHSDSGSPGSSISPAADISISTSAHSDGCGPSSSISAAANGSKIPSAAVLCRCHRPPWLPALIRAGMVGFSFQLIRAVRELLLPLQADALELSTTGVGFVTAASYVCDALAFPAGGMLSDRYSRRAAAVPSLLLMGGGLGLLALAHSLTVLVSAAGLLGVGNGLSAGLVMTIGQDAAPSRGRGKFLGLFKLMCDVSQFVGPVTVGLLTHAFSLDAACWAMCAVAAMSSGVCGLLLQPATSSPKVVRHTRKHARLVEEEEEGRELEGASIMPPATAAPQQMGGTKGTRL